MAIKTLVMVRELKKISKTIQLKCYHVMHFTRNQTRYFSNALRT